MILFRRTNMFRFFLCNLNLITSLFLFRFHSNGPQKGKERSRDEVSMENGFGDNEKQMPQNLCGEGNLLCNIIQLKVHMLWNLMFIDRRSSYGSSMSHHLDAQQLIRSFSLPLKMSTLLIFVPKPFRKHSDTNIHN